MKTFKYNSSGYSLDIRFDIETSMIAPIRLDMLMIEIEKLKSLLPSFFGFDVSLFPPRCGHWSILCVCKAGHLEKDQTVARLEMEKLLNAGFQDLNK